MYIKRSPEIYKTRITFWMSFSSQLEPNEFLVLKDTTCHMAEQTAGKQIKIIPSAVRITNLNVYLEPYYGFEAPKKVSLSSITQFAQSTVNDCPVLDIICDDPSKSMHVYISEESNLKAFATILSQICGSTEEGQDYCNIFCRNLRKSICSFNSINDFYRNLNSKPIKDHDFMKISDSHIKDAISDINHAFEHSFNPFNIVADFMNSTPEIFFSLIIIIALFLSALFNYVTFGSFVSLLFVLLLVIIGLMKVTGNDIRLDKFDEKETIKPLQPYVKARNKFAENIEIRLLWKDPRSTLRLATFLLIVALMHVVFDPLFILFIALAGLAFVQRWDPFHVGSFSTMLSHLILW